MMLRDDAADDADDGDRWMMLWVMMMMMLSVMITTKCVGNPYPPPPPGCLCGTGMATTTCFHSRPLPLFVAPLDGDKKSYLPTTRRIITNSTVPPQGKTTIQFRHITLFRLTH
eukprot:TRINITY_DN31356_c0_g1_i1.p1 TRINITY_DN31356_c0_g1~~TRINITY_DN31356_c0_g1_i1.p1  ORF type:complete len:113 (+),score=6.64 TRINITY_DN31356_c0_g1_i1:108-446(+)